MKNQKNPPQQNRQFPPPTTHPPPLHHPYNHRAPPTINLSVYSDYEAKLIEEVTYLHSLWHRGPPSSSSSHLRPTKTTHFKKKQQTPLPCHVSDKEWPVVDTSPSKVESGWPVFQSNNNPVSRPATADERARVLGVKIQLKGVDSCSSLFRRRSDGGDGGGDAAAAAEVVEEEEEDEEDDGDDEEEVEFFEKLFEEDGELRGFYEKNCEGGGGSGEFYCLVCGVIGHKLGRKYKNCVALVQHSVSVSKTKKKKAHRAYGNVICKVLGWDVNRLPSLPIPPPGGVAITGEVIAMSEVKDHIDEDAAVSVMERDAALGKQSETETQTIPDALVRDDVTSTDARCIAIEVTHGEVTEGVVDNRSHADSTVDIEKDVAIPKQSETEMQTISDAPEKDNGTSTDVGCNASELTHGESGRQGSANGLEVDHHDSIKDTTCSSPENAVSQPENDPMLDKEVVVNKTGDGCSVLGSESIECELHSPLVADDPYEQLQCLSGEFQIPE